MNLHLRKMHMEFGTQVTMVSHSSLLFNVVVCRSRTSRGLWPTDQICQCGFAFWKGQLKPDAQSVRCHHHPAPYLWVEVLSVVTVQQAHTQRWWQPASLPFSPQSPFVKQVMWDMLGACTCHSNNPHTTPLPKWIPGEGRSREAGQRGSRSHDLERGSNSKQLRMKGIPNSTVLCKSAQK